MLKPELMIPDDLKDEVGILLSQVRAEKGWKKQKRELMARVAELMLSQGAIGFIGHPTRYFLERNGQSYLYDVPSNRRGHLAVFRGRRVRIVCVGSGKFDRTLLACPVK